MNKVGRVRSIAYGYNLLMNTCHTRPMPPHNQHVTLTQRGNTLKYVTLAAQASPD